MSDLAARRMTAALLGFSVGDKVRIARFHNQQKWVNEDKRYIGLTGIIMYLDEDDFDLHFNVRIRKETAKRRQILENAFFSKDQLDII